MSGDSTTGSDAESYLAEQLSLWDRAAPGKKPSAEELCAERPDLIEEFRRRVRALQQADEMLAGRSPGLAEGPGTVIGPYKILQQIGEGGFGCVFMAEQQRPVHRKVALKVIKLGMDTRMVIARFEAERQALAMMDHPNI